MRAGGRRRRWTVPIALADELSLADPDRFTSLPHRKIWPRRRPPTQLRVGLGRKYDVLVRRWTPMEARTRNNSPRFAGRHRRRRRPGISCTSKAARSKLIKTPSWCCPRPPTPTRGCFGSSDQRHHHRRLSGRCRGLVVGAVIRRATASIDLTWRTINNGVHRARGAHHARGTSGGMRRR